MANHDWQAQVRLHGLELPGVIIGDPQLIVFLAAGAGPLEEDLSSLLSWQPKDVAPSQEEACRAGTLEQLVDHLVLAQLTGDHFFVPTFLSTYRKFAKPQQVLDLLFQSFTRCEALQESSKQDEILPCSSQDGMQQDQLRNAISSILGMWLDQYWEDFCQPPQFPCLRQLLAHLKVYMAGTDVEGRAHLLLAQMEAQEQSQAEPDGTTENVLSKEKPDVLAFPPPLVAEQLTWMDAELFQKVLPHHCLLSVCSQRDKKDMENLAPTIRATFTQFHRVFSCVLTTCVGDHSMQACNRARVLEHWIMVAMECRVLRNFSSLHAIVSALQSTAMQRMQNTWHEVSRDSLQVFQKLSEIISPACYYFRTKVLLFQEPCDFASKDKKAKRGQKQSEEMVRIKGTIPYLETFLSDFRMIDTAFRDFLDEGIIHYEKLRKEYTIMEQLKQLQSSCSYDHITPNENFLAWFRSLERLSEEASCQAQSTGLSTSGSSQFKSLEQDKCGPDTSSTDNTGVHCNSTGKSAGASSSYPELNRSLMGESSEDQEKLKASSCQSIPGTLAINLASPSQSSPTDSSTPETTTGNSQSCVSGHTSDSSSRHPYTRQGDSCVIRVILPVENKRLCRSILVTNQEKTRDVILKAMRKFRVRRYKPEDLELVQIISQDQKLRIPDDANVFYALKTMDFYHVVLRKYTFPLRTNVKQGSSSSLFHTKRSTSCKS
ncbi:ral guanine nucleotide dissociation stimulator-like [Dipodomys spectabilis]|uniref:ral guanine nucleotide dissociation stimulator-like n=1 Tax=Dipodomys spectabilis TaxID=105255 RepID=UPI001C54ABA7|nr:ral guanine nucleotide dissociation stimulator-like [Dipodomys spectabilis]